MTDEQAIELANLLAEYARASVKEGCTLDEVGDWTVRELLDDIVQTTPTYLEGKLDATVRELIAS